MLMPHNHKVIIKYHKTPLNNKTIKLNLITENPT